MMASLVTLPQNMLKYLYRTKHHTDYLKHSQETKQFKFDCGIRKMLRQVYIFSEQVDTKSDMVTSHTH